MFVVCFRGIYRGAGGGGSPLFFVFVRGGSVFLSFVLFSDYFEVLARV